MWRCLMCDAHGNPDGLRATVAEAEAHLSTPAPAHCRLAEYTYGGRKADRTSVHIYKVPSGRLLHRLHDTRRWERTRPGRGGLVHHEYLVRFTFDSPGTFRVFDVTNPEDAKPVGFVSYGDGVSPWVSHLLSGEPYGLHSTRQAAAEALARFYDYQGGRVTRQWDGQPTSWPVAGPKDARERHR